MYKKSGIKTQNISKKFFIALPAVILLAAGIWFAASQYKKRDDRGKTKTQVYEALIQVTDQNSADPAEDARSSLKKGDVIAVFPEGHPWTETERISYLILKIRLEPEQAEQLTQAEKKDVTQNESGAAGGAESSRGMLPRKEIITARQYRIKVEKLKYDPQKLYEGQPYPEKIFDYGIIEKKNK